MLRGWLRAPLPGPAPPAWEGAGAARRGLRSARRTRAAATEEAAAEEEEKEGRWPRTAGLAGGAPEPWAAAAAAGSPRSGLSAPLFVSAPGEGRVMSLLPGAGKQRRDKVTYPAPYPRPASPRSGRLRRGRICRAGARRAGSALPGGTPKNRSPRAGKGGGVPGNATPPRGSCSRGPDPGPPLPRPALRLRSSPSRGPQSGERAGLTWGGAELRSGDATRRGLGAGAGIKVGNQIVLAIRKALCICIMCKKTLLLHYTVTSRLTRCSQGRDVWFDK